MSAPVHQRKFFQFGKRPRRVEATQVIQVVRQVSAQQDFPRHGRRLRVHPRVKQYTGCAVGRKGIVVTRPLAQVVHRLDIIEKHPPQVLKRSVDPIDIDVLLGLTVGGPHPHDVALVGDDVIEFILSEKTRQGRITLALLFARLDRNC